MSLIGPAELMILGLRLLFALALYGVVGAVLVALRRDLRGAVAAASGRGRAGWTPGGTVIPSAVHGQMAGGIAPGDGAAGEGRLTLLEAAPMDGSPGRVVPLRGELTIGRRPPAEVVLQDEAVSGRHARLARRDGEWTVEDLGSTNGTYVNGARLTAPAPLRPGDIVVTGNAAWRYEEAGRSS